MTIVSIDVVRKAISFAACRHKDQTRDDDKTPYISHPFRVAIILSAIFRVTDENILAAAVLHDTIEDTKTDYDDLLAEFNYDVANWVSFLSKDKTLDEKKRESKYITKLRHAPEPVVRIKIADLVDNVRDASTAETAGKLEKTIKKAEDYIRVFSVRREKTIRSDLKQLMQSVETQKRAAAQIV